MGWGLAGGGSRVLHTFCTCWVRVTAQEGRKHRSQYEIADFSPSYSWVDSASISVPIPKKRRPGWPGHKIADFSPSYSWVDFGEPFRRQTQKKRPRAHEKTSQAA